MDVCPSAASKQIRMKPPKAYYIGEKLANFSLSLSLTYTKFNYFGYSIHICMYIINRYCLGVYYE